MDYWLLSVECNFKILFQSLEDFGAPHIKAFDWLVDEGLDLAMKELNPITFELPSKDRVMLRISVIIYYVLLAH